MTKKTRYCKKKDCADCMESCIAYPGMEHANGTPFCKAEFPTKVHHLAGYIIVRGDMTPIHGRKK